jgi:protein NEDD1
MVETRKFPVSRVLGSGVKKANAGDLVIVKTKIGGIAMTNLDGEEGTSRIKRNRLDLKERTQATLDVPKVGTRMRTNSSASTASLDVSARSTEAITRIKESISAASSSATDKLLAGRQSRARLISSASSGFLSATSKTSARTPSPDLPALDEDPISPVKMSKGNNGIGVLGLGTPEVEKWVRAGEGTDNKGQGKGKGGVKGKGKRVGFVDESDDENESTAEAENIERATVKENMALEISPRRPTTTTSKSWTTVPSPLRHSSTSPSSSGSAPHDLLRTIMSDVMYDLHREQKAQMVGMHLDMVRMGRGWRKEMGNIIRELGELKEENGRLRAENERLRRGY